MELKNIIFVIIATVSFILLFFSLKKKIHYLQLGKDEDRFKNIPQRLKNVLTIGLFQKKLVREKIAGYTHVIIFSAFLIFLFAIIEGLIQGIYSPFTLEFLGPFYSVITFVQDVLSVLVIIAVLVALFRRYILRVERLDVGKHGLIDATFILGMIFLIVVSMIGQNMTGLTMNNFAYSEYEYRPVSLFFAKMVYSANSGALNFNYEIFWWIHILLIFVFMNYLPYSKHFHVYTSLPNVYFKKLGKDQFSIQSIDLEDENIEQFGAVDIEDLTWKQLLDGFACTECGRCTAACPAANTGKLLSPRKIIVDIRHRLEEKAPYKLANKEIPEEVSSKTLLHSYIEDEEIWSCTTCNACVYECPVTIEHIDAIVDMRRNLVLMESQFPPELNNVFKNIETNFTPWAFNPQDRAEWAEGMGIKTMAEDPDCDILFWVGCAGSFDARAQKVTKATAELFQKADVDFRILGTEEKCNGDTARRLGNEYLAQMMMMENVETLNNYKVKKIVTACPHCFNSLKNEYPQFGGNFEVVHHSEFLLDLIEKGKIKLNKNEIKNIVTYHDSCYLGRYNEIYDAPRAIASKIEGMKLIEMERSFDKGFCCGAGGGRMFLEETRGERINVNRTKEAVATNADTVLSACPFCMTMLNDGLKDLEKTEEVSLKDISEIILENSQ